MIIEDYGTWVRMGTRELEETFPLEDISADLVVQNLKKCGMQSLQDCISKWKAVVISDGRQLGAGEMIPYQLQNALIKAGEYFSKSKNAYSIGYDTDRK